MICVLAEQLARLFVVAGESFGYATAEGAVSRMEMKMGWEISGL